MIDTTASKRRNNGVDLPEDFPQRLESFRDVSGLSWGELAACLGVDHERVMNWRRGVLPRDFGPAEPDAAGAAGIRRHGRAVPQRGGNAGR